MRRFKGFTLTELMVALAVIGIIVAVVTPAIIKNRPNKNKMMIKKSFYAAENLVNGLINDENLYPDKRDFCGESPAQQVDPNLDYCAFGFDYTEQGRSADGLTYGGVNANTQGYKFAAVFKDNMNVKSDYTGANNGSVSIKNPAAANGNITFYPIFYTTDGIKWDLTGTRAAWTHRNNNTSVGTFDIQNNTTPGIGTITVDVNGDERPNAFCTDANEDCDQYQIQILANGKMRINPNHIRAVNYATINTSIKDEMNE